MTSKIFLLSVLALATSAISAKPKTYYVSTTGADTNAGTISAPFATLGKAYSTINSGDTIYFRGGTYTIQQSEIMTAATSLDVSHYCYVFNLTKAGTASARTVIAGYPGERPVLDFSAVKPTCRIVAFAMSSNYLHLKNFEITGVQATLHGHYQSIAIYAVKTANSIVENVAMHHNKSIGYYATHGSNNLVKNCDAYCNYDNYSAFKTDEDYQNYLSTGKAANCSETLGGNSDGFGYHACHTSDTGCRFENCRAWWNSDDGFDCINSKTAVVWDSCWAFYNGLEPNTKIARGDGNGFKAGGYGMSTPCTTYPQDASGNPAIPRNTISNCVAYENKSNGFYANHHLGGNNWYNDIAVYNGVGSSSSYNFNMLNRELETVATAATNVEGYDHVIKNCVSYYALSGRAWINVGSTCTDENNITIASNNSTQFIDGKVLAVTSTIPLMNARNTDGSLPDVEGFLTAKNGSDIFVNKQGALFESVAASIEKNITYIPVTNTQNAYNLAGQRVGTSFKGIVIKNGRKYIVR